MPHAIVTLQQMRNSTFPQVLCFSWQPNLSGTVVDIQSLVALSLHVKIRSVGVTEVDVRFSPYQLM
jgi:hypothetical protein